MGGGRGGERERDRERESVCNLWPCNRPQDVYSNICELVSCPWFSVLLFLMWIHAETIQPIPDDELRLHGQIHTYIRASDCWRARANDA